MRYKRLANRMGVKMNRLSIVGIFYDGYSDMWEDFVTLFKKKWKDCPYPLYIINGQKDLETDDAEGITVIHAGADAEYSRKVQTAINEIDSDYLLLLLEDDFFEKELESDALENILDVMDSEKISYLRMPMKEFISYRDKKIYKYDKNTGLRFISSNNEYTVTCMPSIWKKDFLKQCIGTGNYNAWIFEGIYSYSQYAHTTEFLYKCRVSLDNVLHLRHGAVQGKFIPNVYNDFAKQGYTFKTNREVLSSVEHLKYTAKRALKDLTPLAIHKFIKRVIKKRSVIDKYKDEINEQIKAMNLK